MSRTKHRIEEMKRKKVNETRDSLPSDNFDTIENVLVLQGGGSLGAFGCGVFKAIANYNIKLDIIAGTSIGGINAAIIAGSKDEKHPEKALERFWLELSEGFVDLGSNCSSSFRFYPENCGKLASTSVRVSVQRRHLILRSHHKG